MIKLVIFDCDGVMFDSRAANEVFYNHILAHFNLPPMNPKELDYVHTATAQQSLDRIIKDPDLRPEAHKFRLSMDYTPFIEYMELNPQLMDLLAFLKKDRYTAVATNRTDTMSLIVDKFGLEPHFDLVVSSLDVERPKPYPDQVLLILDRLKVEKDQAIFIGDGDTDEGAALAAGVPLVAYRNPGLKAEYYIDDLFEIKDIVASQD